jgi:hypothetical protein
MIQQLYSQVKPKRNENICPRKNLYRDGHSYILRNRKKVETIQMSIKWWMDKTNGHIYNLECYLAIKKNEVPSIYRNMAKSWENILHDTCYRLWFPTYEMIRTGKFRGTQ